MAKSHGNAYRATSDPTKAWELLYRHDGDKYRVWRESWPSDTFEEMTATEFDELRNICTRFAIWLNQVKEND
jgi:hypothetical protein